MLKPTGTFWLAIGDEFAAELKLIFQRELGLIPRSWVIWYYTFGVHCTKKFTRSHAHLFHFVKDPKQFTFNDQDDPRPLGAATRLLRPPRRPQGPPPRRHLDPPPAGRPRGLPARRRHLVLPPRLRHLQGARRLARLPDARTAPGPDHPRLLEPRRGRPRPLRRQRHDAGRRQEAGSAPFLGFELSPDYAAQIRARLDVAHEGQRLEGGEEPLAGGKRTPGVRSRRLSFPARVRPGMSSCLISPGTKERP